MKRKFVYYCQLKTGVVIESNMEFEFSSGGNGSHTLWLDKRRGQLFWINSQPVVGIWLKWDDISVRYAKEVTNE